ncbi:MAG: hypothetical protein O9264_10240 [Leptospira sp.]|nr:hypothetical protein [Leptospira sp.]
MINETYFDDFTNNAYSKAGEHHSYTDKNGWPRPKFACDDFFFHAFSLETSRGNHNDARYANNSDCDYDPKYWGDTIYQPIWNPREMGTLEQLGIKEVK